MLSRSQSMELCLQTKRSECSLVCRMALLCVEFQDRKAKIEGGPSESLPEAWHYLHPSPRAVPSLPWTWVGSLRTHYNTSWYVGIVWMAVGHVSQQASIFCWWAVHAHVLWRESSREHSRRCENNPVACLHGPGSMQSDQRVTSKPHPESMSGVGWEVG